MAYTIEIIGIIFILAMSYLTYIEYKKKNISKIVFLFWDLVWLTGVFLILLHEQANKFLDPLNIIRVMDLYMILAFMFLFIIIFYLFIRNKQTEKRLEKLTRIIALRRIKR
jgi:hypothetical protein